MSGNNVRKQPQINLLSIKNAIAEIKDLCAELHDNFGMDKCKFCPIRAKETDSYACYFQQLYDDESSAEPMEWTLTDIGKVPRLFE